MSNALLVKLCVIGDAKVGKSSVVKRFIDDEFSDDYICTIGIEFSSRIIDFRGDATKLQIWDTAGQERFRSIVSSYYRDSKGYIIMYDVTDIDSFNHVEMWVDNIAHFGSKNTDPFIILVGNKSDVDSNSRVVDAEEGRALALKLGIPFFETSAKSASNVDDVFLWMVTGIRSRIAEQTQNSRVSTS